MSAALPLAGLKVVEFTHMVMGPAAGAILAGLGAEVVRVEPPGGDHTRDLIGSGAGYFPMYNRHKASVTLDLKSASGLEAARRLVAASDILIENFRPGALDRLGLDYDTLAAAQPGLIYCSLKGFLPGPYDQRTALDEVAQMMGGLAYMTGPPGRPLRAGSSVIDVTGGMFGVIAILAAVEQRHRTGTGQKVAAALFETTVYLVGQHMAQLAVTGAPAAPMPTRISAWAIYDVFETRDQPIFIGVVSDALWEKFCALFDLHDLWADPTLRRNADRVRARDRILPDVRRLIAGFARDDLVAKLEGSGLPFAPIGRPEDMAADPHLLASGALEEVRMRDGRIALLPRIPVALESAPPQHPRDLPAAGADSLAVLIDLGYSPDEAIALSGVKGSPAPPAG